MLVWMCAETERPSAVVEDVCEHYYYNKVGVLVVCVCEVCVLGPAGAGGSV